MKNNLKVKPFIAIAMIIMIIAITTIANAATGENYSVGMSLTSSSKLNVGDTVTVNVNLTSVNAGNGIDTITAALDYDTSVFEVLSTSNFTASNEWTPSYASASKMLTLLKNTKVTAPETVLTINFKVKSSISVNSTKITLKDIVVSGGRISDGGTGDITVNNAIITINKTEDSSSSTEKPTNNTTTGGTTTTNKTTNSTTKNTTVKDNTTTAKTTLPKTGAEQYGVIAIVVVAIVAIFSYVIYKKIAKEVK